MKKRIHNRTTTHDLSKRLKQRFYKIAAIATLVYVTLSLIKFHGELENLPQELAIIWAVFLLCYTGFKEMLRWNNVEDVATYRGGLWAALVMGGAIWMIGWNIVRAWAFHLPTIPFSGEYQAATIETIVLYTLSIVSASLYKYNKTKRYPVRHKARGKIAQQEQKAISSPLAQGQEMQAVLTKADTLDGKNTPPEEKEG